MRSKVDIRWLAVLALLALAVAIPAGVLGQGTTSTTFLKGSITTNEPQPLTSAAIAVVTIVDRSARGGSGVIIGQKRIIPSGTTPVTFSVRYDPARIQSDHAYVVFATILDEAKTFQNADGVPVITGGPTTGVDVPVKRLPGTPVATIPGEITKNDKAALSGKAVAVAAVLDSVTGRTVAWTAITPSGDTPIAFQLGYDPATLEPGAQLVAWAGIVDQLSVWESTAVTPLITADQNLSAGSITVSPATPLPAAPEPTPTPTPVTVPEVWNQPEADAVRTLEDADLGVGETSRKYNANVADGNAVRTSPEAGTQVQPGSNVKLVVSKGPSPSPSPTPTPTPTPRPTPTPAPTPPPVAIPDVRNLPEADAVIEVTDAGLKVGERPQRYNEKVKAGNAIKTEPVAGTKVKPGSVVDVYVSKGPQPSVTPTPTAAPATPTPTPQATPVVVPDVRGLSEADAVVELSDADLKVGDRNQRAHASVDEGDVIKTAPEGGVRVQPGSRVDLFISTGPEPTPTPRPVEVPDVRGVPEPDAIIALTDADLEIGERLREHDEDVPSGAVIETDPRAGDLVPPGTFVDLVVSDGPEATPSPTPIPTPIPTPTPPPTATPVVPWPYPTVGIGILSGSLIYREPTEPGSNRQVVITLLEEGSFGSRVVPIEQYVDDGGAPQGFVVTFDWAQIDPFARYRVLAAIVDGTNSWYTQDGTQAITGGAPVSGLLVPLFLRGDILEGQVTGVIVGVDADLSTAATYEAFLVRGDTGAVVAYDAGSARDGRLQLFNVPYLLTDVDQAVRHLIVARVIDGPSLWTGPGVPVVTQGAPFRVVVPVTLVTGPAQVLDAPGS